MILKFIVLMSTFLFSQDPCICENDFNPDAFLDDGSCIFPCEGDFNYDGNKDILDVIFLVNEIIDGVICE